MLRFSEVFKCRKAQCGFALDTGSDACHLIDDKTLQKRIEAVLAGKVIILKCLRYRIRLYVSVAHLNSMMSDMARSWSKSLDHLKRLSIEDAYSYIEEVSVQFMTAIGDGAVPCQKRYLLFLVLFGPIQVA